MKRLSYAFWCLSVVIVISITGSVAVVERLHSNKKLPAEDPARDVIKATIDQIDQESRNFDIAKTAAAHHIVKPKEITSITAETSARPLIEGYTVSEFHGEMKKGVLDPAKRYQEKVSFPVFEWLENPNSVELLINHAKKAERDWSFGVVLLEDELALKTSPAMLQTFGVEIVGSNGKLSRAKLPADEERLKAIAGLDSVVSIAPIPESAKVSELARDMFQSMPHESLPIFITLMGLDPDGHWRRSLETLGASVGDFDPTIRVYAAHATYDAITKIAAADFVLAIDPIGIVEAAHDTAIPSMGADSLRMYDGVSGLFSGIGGASVPIAVMDTGLNRSHDDIASNRESICGANFVNWDPLVEDSDLWVDKEGHGSHVTGTLAGNGASSAKYAGFAPLIRHIRFAKVLNQAGSGTGFFIYRGMEFLKNPIACYGTLGMSEAVQPLIVNMSLSANSLRFEGRNAGARKLDSVVWEQKQLYVVAHSNASIHGFSNYAAAKNSLSVGATLDDGALASFSSHGPTADGRLSPQVVGTGVNVWSTEGNGSTQGYEHRSGTSMSSPAVAGVAALVMDSNPAFRARPALTRARLMASAIKADAWIEASDAFRSDNSNGPGSLQTQYGLGLVSARTSVLQRDEPNGWKNGSAVSTLQDGEYAFLEVDVVENTARLDVVLTWDEPPGDTLSNTVLNDLDLWIDQNGDCTNEPCGEYVSRSRKDNVEWIIISNPNPGVYRIKIAATRVYTDAPRAAVAWTMIRDVAKPSLAINVDQEIVELNDIFDEAELIVSITSDAFVAAGTRLQIDCRSVSERNCGQSLNIDAVTRREDFIEQSVYERGGLVIEVGELAIGETWEVPLRIRFRSDNDLDEYRLYFKANAWNGNSDSTSVLVHTSASTESNTSTAGEPTNNAFANAKSIEGNMGDDTIDLVRATVEPFEPLFDRWLGYPLGSVWYKWLATSSEKVSFGVAPSGSADLGEVVRIDAFQGNHLADLVKAASAEWSVQFFPKAGQTYWIRISHQKSSVPLILSWSVGPRPSNDQFVAAVRLTGTEGTVEGSNAGATVEIGESFGNHASSVWYSWVAPSDGDWEFRTNGSDLRVLVFRGDQLRNLRLISNFPTSIATFPARGGEVYRVVVTSDLTPFESGGRSFVLSWSDVERESSNDDFENAESISAEVSSHRIEIDRKASVEPGEPVESGIRTNWWVWTAPQDRTYTWRIKELTQSSGAVKNRMMLSVFSGSGLEDLQLVASNGPQMVFEFKFDAIGGRMYWISAAMPAHDHVAFYQHSFSGTLVWGETPGHDEPQQALLLGGLSGSATGNSEFATSSLSERNDLVGWSTIWWTYETEKSSWFRFVVDGEGRSWRLTIHSGAGEGISTQTPLATSGSKRQHQWQLSENELLVHLKRGHTYTIGLGVLAGDLGGEFTLRWEPTNDPGGLLLVGQFVDGDKDVNGNFVSLLGSEEVVSHPSGQALYLPTDDGLLVFEREIETGEIEPIQLLESDVYFADYTMVWDELRDRLLLHECDVWESFVRFEGGPKLSYSGRVDLNSNDCNYSFQLLMDHHGLNIYSINSYVMRHHVVNSEGLVTNALLHEFSDSVNRAILTQEGDYLYVTTGVGINVYEIDSFSGALTLAEYDEKLLDGYCCRAPMVLTEDDEFLIAFDGPGNSRANLFSLENRLQPELLDSLTAFWEPQYSSTNCYFADIRGGRELVDVLCDDLIYTLEFDREAATLRGVSWLRGDSTDASGDYVPSFYKPIGFAVGPDDEYLYMNTQDAGLVILSRDLAGLFDVPGPDLVVRTMPVNGANQEPRGSFELRAVVSNRGDRMSDTTTLRFYRSDDSLISTNDVMIGNATLNPISVSGQLSLSFRIPLAQDHLNYHYGACIDEKIGESDLDNNCSTAVRPP